jgi:hypothetical protein
VRSASKFKLTQRRKDAEKANQMILLSAS